MAPINEGISHPHNRPGSKSYPINQRISGPHNRPDAKTSNAQKDWVPKAPRGAGHKPVIHSPPTPAACSDSTNGDPSPPPSPPPASGTEPDNNPSCPDDMDDGGMGTLEKMLTPPESDTEPQSKNQDLEVYVNHYQPSRVLGPFIPQPPNPLKETKGSLDLRRVHNTRSNNGTGNDNVGTDNEGDNDGDDEDDNTPDDLITPGFTSSATASQLDPPTTPRRVLRSQGTDSDSDSQSVSPRTLAPKPKPKPNRKRNDSKTDAVTPIQGQRVSKRQRNSLGDSPLPPMPRVKRTRAEQKKYESKLGNLIFDPQRPGSVERGLVEIKSGAKKWRTASLHDELWDGNSKPE